MLIIFKRMAKQSKWLILGLALLLAAPDFANAAGSFVVSGQIIKPDGTTLTSSTVNFKVEVKDSAAGSCVLWSETFANTDMSATDGNFSLAMGAGVRQDGGAHQLNEVFSNQKVFGVTAVCPAGYTPAAGDERSLKITFDDSGGATQTFTSQSVKPVPTASAVGDYGVANLAKISGVGSATTLTPTQYNFLGTLSAMTSTSTLTCSTGQYLKYNGTDWICAAGGSGVTSVGSANADVAVVNGSTTPVLTLNSGTGANQIVKLDASAKLPAVDASQVTNLNASVLASGTIPAARLPSFTGDVAISGTVTTISGLARSKIASGTANHVLINDGSGNLSSEASLAIARGGTGASTATGAINALVPTQTGNASKVLSTDGTVVSWVAQSGGLPAAAGTAAAPGYAFSANTNTGMFSPGANQIAFANNGIEKMRLDASGNMGIGTVAPGSALDVKGTLRLSGSTSGFVGFAPAPAAGSTTYTLPSADGSSGQFLSTNGAGILSWGTPGGGGTVTGVSSANTDIGVATGSSTPVLTLNAGTGANQIVKLDGASKLPAVDASQVTGLTATQISSGVLPIARGGTNSGTALNNNRLMISSGGAVVEAGAMTDGQIVVGKAAFPPQIVTMTGDATVGNTGVVTVGKLQGRIVAATPPSLGAFLKWNNTLSQWEPAVQASCSGATQVMHYNSITDVWSCDTMLVDNLLPAQIGNSGKFLMTNGTTTGWVTAGGGGDALIANPLSQFAATTSAQLALVLSDETGSGQVVYSGSPTLTGVPLAPTAAADTNTTQIATTAFVQGQASATAALMDGAAAAGTSVKYARADHIHPVDTSRAPAAGSASITTVGTITSGIWNGTAIAVANGGTGATNANSAFNNLAPAQTGNGGKFLTTDGTNTSWVSGGIGDALTGNPLSQFASTTSSQLASVLSDETGTGSAVFGTSPTFTTSITSPVILGGTGSTSSLIYQTTTGVSVAGADHIFKVGNNGATEAMRILSDGRVVIGATTTNHDLHLTKNKAGLNVQATAQNTSPTGDTFWVAQNDTTNRGYIGIRGSGQAGTGTSAANAFTLGVIGTNLNVATDGAPIQFWISASEKARIDASGNFGVGVAAPTAALHLKAGVAGAGGAPLKLSTGTNLATPEPGAIEYDGSNLYYTDSVNTRHALATAGAGITSLNGITAGVQTFATGTAGSDFGIIPSGSTHIFNIPTASALNRGALSSADWSTFDAKLGASTSFVGDVNGTYNATSVDKIKGKVVSVTAPTTAQFLVYDGATQYAPVSLGGDVTMTTNGTSTVGKINGNVVSGVGLASNNVLQNISGGSLGANNILITNGTGTGVISMTSPASGVLTSSANVPSWSNSVSPAMGGTGLTTYTTGDLLYASSSVALSRLPASTAGYVLTTNGIGSNPSWTSVVGLPAAAGTATAPGYSFNGDAGVGMFDASGSLGFTTSGTERMRILSSGNIGIGTSSPSGIFEVNGGTASGSTSGTNITIAAQNGGAGATNGGNIILNTGAPGTGTPGKIGVNTASPTSMLTIQNRPSSLGVLEANNSVGSTLLYVYNGGGVSVGATNSSGSDRLTVNGFGSTSATNSLVVKNAVPTTNFVIRDDGNVGVGTSVPGEKLDVLGGVRLGQAPGTLTTLSALALAGDTSLSVGSTTGYPSSGTLLVDSEAIAYTGLSSSTFTGLTRGAFGTTAAGHSASAVVSNYLLAVSSASANPKMVVTSAGKVGIGTAAPGVASSGLQVLDVNGPVRFGAVGTTVASMGVCQTAPFTPTNTAVTQTCTGVPGSTFVSVSCSASAAFTTPNSTVIYARATGAADQISVNLSAANSVTLITLTCMWMKP